jgi:hypothetical protein
VTALFKACRIGQQTLPSKRAWNRLYAPVAGLVKFHRKNKDACLLFLAGTVTASSKGLTPATQSFTITISPGAIASDTPAMPLLGLVILAVLLVIIATKLQRRITKTPGDFENFL